MTDNERAILEKMKDGYELVTGRGLWGLHCRLQKGTDSFLVHRAMFSKLRNEGLVRYAATKRKPGFHSDTRLLAVLTESGRKALEDEVPSV